MVMKVRNGDGGESKGGDGVVVMMVVRVIKVVKMRFVMVMVVTVCWCLWGGGRGGGDDAGGCAGNGGGGGCREPVSLCYVKVKEMKTDKETNTPNSRTEKLATVNSNLGKCDLNIITM